ncbi:hypothetical protein [Demequina pelophila]|uniref:hypothetical protein n=1 Tax=Demequina pelophila TaxID=1638984 RepID=UPI0007812FDF|nr:hypothetical protein [Demequina pelophila]
MSTVIRPRKSPSERVTGAVWGVIVAALGGLGIAALSGWSVDAELALIIALAAMGGWLLASALAVGVRQRRREREALAALEPTVEEPPVGEPLVDEPTTDSDPAPTTVRDTEDR